MSSRQGRRTPPASPNGDPLPKLKSDRSNSIPAADLRRTRTPLSGTRLESLDRCASPGVQEDGDLLVLRGPANAKLIISKPGSGKPQLQWSFDGAVDAELKPGALLAWQNDEPATVGSSSQAPASTAEADEECDAIMLALDMHERTVLDVREEHFQSRQKRLNKSCDTAQLLRDSAEREGKLLRLVASMRDNAKGGVTRMRAYYENKVNSLQHRLDHALKENETMSRSLDAASSQPTDKQQSSNSSTKTLVTDHDLLARVNDAEGAQAALVSELMMVRAEATVTRQKMLDDASAQEARLMGLAHESAIRGSAQLQVAEIEHKEKINSLMHELTLAQAAGSKEVPGSEQEAKELCVSQHYELMQEIWKGHEHSVHDIRRAAEAQEALLRKELLETRLAKEELCNQFMIDRKNLEAQLRTETHRAANAASELEKILAALDAANPKAVLLHEMQEMRSHAIDHIAQAQLTCLTQQNTLTRSLSVVEQGASDALWKSSATERENGRLATIIDLLKRRLESKISDPSSEGTDLTRVIEDHRKETEENQARIHQLTAEVRKLRQDLLNKEIDEAEQSQINQLQTQVATLTAQITMLQQQLAGGSTAQRDESLDQEHADELQALQSQIVDLKAEIEKLLGELAACKAQVVQLKKELANAGPAVEQDPAELAEAVGEAADEVERIRQLLKNSTGEEALKLMDKLKEAESEFAEALMRELECEVLQLREQLKKQGGDKGIVVREQLVSAELKLVECRERLGLPFAVHAACQTEGVNEAERERQWAECVDYIGSLGNESWAEYASSGELTIVVRELWRSCQTMKTRMDKALHNQEELDVALAATSLELESAHRESGAATRQLSEKQADVRMMQQKLRLAQDLNKELQNQHQEDLMLLNALNDEIDNHKMKSESLQRLVDRHEKATEERLQELVGGHNDACELARSKASLNEKLLDRTAELEKLVEELELQLRKAQQTHPQEEPLEARLNLVARLSKSPKRRKPRADWLGGGIPPGQREMRVPRGMAETFATHPGLGGPGPLHALARSSPAAHPLARTMIFP